MSNTNPALPDWDAASAGPSEGPHEGVSDGGAAEAYRLDEHVGFQLRRANQRHLAIFASLLPDLTPTQFAALAKLAELGPLSQNELGRATAMDAATIKGVIDRLRTRGLVATSASPDDRRLRMIALTGTGTSLFAHAAEAAFTITAATLAPLTGAERQTLLRLLRKLA